MSDITVQGAESLDNGPTTAQITQWAQLALDKLAVGAPLCISIVSEAQIQDLNLRFRGKDKTTNVLSFPADAPDFLLQELGLGDVLICPQVVASEALHQDKTLADHWAHMVLHGVLHLCGYDHIEDREAETMEAIETEILAAIGISAPYRQTL